MYQKENKRRGGASDTIMRNDDTMTGRDQGLTAEEYCCFRELIERQTGVLLMDDKRLPFHMKVSHRLEILGIGTYQEYYDAIMSDQVGRDNLRERAG